MEDLLKSIRNCRACEAYLPLGPKPIVQGGPEARIVIIGQAPGTKAHASGIPWNDASGERLREWLGLSQDEFYDPKTIAILPMGFCYPGRAKSGDVPPRKECFPLWHELFLSSLPHRELTLLIGKHAQNAYLGARQKQNATETIRAWREYLPEYIPLPHPSPRNNIWLKKNEWFTQEVIPAVRERVLYVLNNKKGHGECS